MMTDLPEFDQDVPGQAAIGDGEHRVIPFPGPHGEAGAAFASQAGGAPMRRALRRVRALATQAMRQRMSTEMSDLATRIRKYQDPDTGARRRSFSR